MIDLDQIEGLGSNFRWPVSFVAHPSIKYGVAALDYIFFVDIRPIVSLNRVFQHWISFVHLVQSSVLSSKNLKMCVL